uniref:Uncharacterized protein n=1 Tax=Arundo donax TaxID=35708 RepID=A0A0A9AVC5_ARUDO
MKMIPEGSIRRVKLSVASNEEIVSALIYLSCHRGSV